MGWGEEKFTKSTSVDGRSEKGRRTSKQHLGKSLAELCVEPSQIVGEQTSKHPLSKNEMGIYKVGLPLSKWPCAYHITKCVRLVTIVTNKSIPLILLPSQKLPPIPLATNHVPQSSPKGECLSEPFSMELRETSSISNTWAPLVEFSVLNISENTPSNDLQKEIKRPQGKVSP